jgi:transcriptional regulator with XRE-family HTH domain
MILGMRTLEILRADLDRARGQWPKIASETGLDHSTIARIARADIPNPRIQTVDRIREWLDANLPADS